LLAKFEYEESSEKTKKNKEKRENPRKNIAFVGKILFFWGFCFVFLGFVSVFVAFSWKNHPPSVCRHREARKNN